LARTSQPRFRSNGLRSITVAHREEFATLPSAVQFTAHGFPINPGTSSCFPWLSQIAMRYETYKFRSLVFRYIAQCPTTTVGSCTIAVDYDVNDENPGSMQEVRSMRDRQGGALWSNWELRAVLPVGDKLPARYVRAGTLLQSELGAYDDPRMSDVGRFFFCVQGAATESYTGYLEVEYIVDLFEPQMQPGVGGVVTFSSTHSAPFGAIQQLSSCIIAPFYTGLAPSNHLFFHSNFEGMISATFHGQSIADVRFSVVGDGAKCQHMYQYRVIVDVTATHAVCLIAVKMLPHTQLFVDAADTSLSDVTLYFAPGPYEMLAKILEPPHLLTQSPSSVTPVVSTSTSTSTNSVVEFDDDDDEEPSPKECVKVVRKK